LHTCPINIAFNSLIQKKRLGTLLGTSRGTSLGTSFGTSHFRPTHNVYAKAATDT